MAEQTAVQHSEDQPLKGYAEGCDFSISPDEQEEALRMSLLCQHAYGDVAELPAGWTVCTAEVDGLKRRDDEQGLRCQLYTSGGLYVLAFAGRYNDKGTAEAVQQLLGGSVLYQTAVQNGEKVAATFGVQNVLFAGHSIGGGLATACAMATGATAITFNPTWLSAVTRSKVAKYPSVKVTNYVVFGEPLDVAQRFPKLLSRVPAANIVNGLVNQVGINPSGTSKYIYCRHIHDASCYIDAHRLKTVVEELTKEKREVPTATDFSTSSLHEVVTEGLKQFATQEMSGIMGAVSPAMVLQLFAAQAPAP